MWYAISVISLHTYYTIKNVEGDSYQMKNFKYLFVLMLAVIVFAAACGNSSSLDNQKNASNEFRILNQEDTNLKN